MPVTIVESDAFPSTLTAPAAGEAASAPGLVSQFLQGIANRTRYLLNHLFDGSGTFAPANSLQISTPTTKTVTLNGVVIDSAADGGAMRSAGSIESRHRVLSAAVMGGTVSVDYYYEHVYGGGTSSGATIWQITNPPNGDATKRWVMKLSNFSSFIVTVKDAAGGTISTLQQNTSTIRAMTIGWNGSSWDVLDYQWYHS
jgi:hypothetical protein